ncbi:MAG: hypothetical protein PHH37_11810 [Paludibacter sp.]|nr:hypothetical protein [Paludibacter sp.]
MKKYIVLSIAMICSVFVTKAVEVDQNDTTVYYNGKTIQIKDSVDQIKVKVFDGESNSLEKIYEGIFSDGKSSEKWTVVEDLGFQIPFIEKLQHKKSKKYKMEAHWAGIGWGFANISDKNYTLNNIDGLTLKSESSNEFYFNFIEKILPFYRNNLGLTSGLGISWHNYFLDMNTHLVEQNDITNVASAPAGITYDYSRLRVFQINVPLLLEWQPTLGKNHKFYIAAGVIGGVNPIASYKVKYKDEDGNTIKKVEAKGLNIAPLSLDYTAQIGYGAWSVYAKYSPFSMFQSGKGPNVRAVSAGIILNF